MSRIRLEPYDKMDIGGDQMNKPDITIQTIDLRVMYLRFKGTYLEFRKNSQALYQRLLSYAQKHNMIVEDQTKVMTIYHDNPFMTAQKNLRTSVAMSISESINNIDDDEITIMDIKGTYAVGRFELKRTEYGEAWTYMVHEYVLKSQEKPRDHAPFEMYITKPPRNAQDKSITDIYIPIER